MNWKILYSFSLTSLPVSETFKECCLDLIEELLALKWSS